MPVTPLVTAFTAIATGAALLGAGLLTMTIIFGGLAFYFSIFDMHIGGFIKKLLMASLGGSFLVGGGGALGLWLKGVFGLP